MMANSINPFMQQYIGEIASPEDFVNLFSPVLIPHFLSLFQKGNVVLRGTQGSGKSMLLNLLKPDISIAYSRAHATSPIPATLRRFLSAGINLTRSDAVSLGQRSTAPTREEDNLASPLYFADFVNYWIVLDLLNSVEKINSASDVFDHLVDAKYLDAFAQALAKEECWFGYLNDITSFAKLKEKITDRISSYRKFHQFNIEEIPVSVRNTKTAIGEPISKTAVCLKEQGVVSPETPVFVRIDQLEFLLESSEIRSGLGQEYRRVINKALSTRDPAISYKLGVRTYAWSNDTRVYGAGNTLELERDYRIEDIDDLLRRQENRRSWVLPVFAEDVFERRLAYVGYDTITITDRHTTLMRKVFGMGTAPKETARRYCMNTTDIRRALRLPADISDAWDELLQAMFKMDPLSATLAAAWAQQTGGAGRVNRFAAPVPIGQILPWDRTWWRKERIRQALMQLAARCGQRMTWGGETQILALSGNNILIFVSLCQHIWDSFLRAQKTKQQNEKINPISDGIPEEAQSIGILSASTHWHDKITETPGGHERKRFVDVLGKEFRRSLLEDQHMSYPGANGFSITNEELDLPSSERVRVLLQQAVDYGVLIEVPHTTKMNDRKPRTKWYLNPIYSPYFNIPETHVKEPQYVRVTDVLTWIGKSENQAMSILNLPTTSKSSLNKELNSSSPQLGLFTDWDPK